MQLVFNTKCPLGTLTSKRAVVIEDPTYTNLCSDYAGALRADDTAKADKARKDLLAKCFRAAIRPGRAIAIDKPNLGKPLGASKAAARVTWEAKSDYLQVSANVIDAGFRTDAPKESPYMTSSVELYISPSGAGQDINQLIIVPAGADGKASVHVMKGEGAASDISATWKRTAKGYMLDACIPWKLLKGYRKGWKVMPIDAAVNYPVGEDRYQAVMTKPGSPWETARAYSALKVK